MAAKFSMVNTSGLFDTEAHLEASDRMQNAMQELKVKNERQERDTETKRAHEARTQASNQQRMVQSRAAAVMQAAVKHESYVVPTLPDNQERGSDDEDDSDDEYLDGLDNDPELERLREARLKQLKQEFEEKQTLLAKGHGEYREITQDEFLKEVTSSPLVAVHFYHRDFERCKIMDMHLARLAKRHIECKFLKLNAEKAPFFVEKLVVRILPTVVCFKDGIAFDERVLGFDGLMDSEEDEEIAAFGSRHATSSDTFPTAALARKMMAIGVLREQDVDEDDLEQ